MKTRILSIIIAVLVLTALFAVSVYANVDLSENRIFKSYSNMWLYDTEGARTGDTNNAIRDDAYVVKKTATTESYTDVLLVYSGNQVLKSGAYTNDESLSNNDGRTAFFTYNVSPEKTINITDFPYFVFSTGTMPSIWIGTSLYRNNVLSQIPEADRASFATPQMKVVIKLYDDETVYEWFCDYTQYGSWTADKHTAVINVTEKYPDISGTVESITIYPTWANIPCLYETANGENWATINAESVFTKTSTTQVETAENIYAILKNSEDKEVTVDVLSFINAIRGNDTSISMTSTGNYLGGFAFLAVESEANVFADALSSYDTSAEASEDDYYQITEDDPNTLDNYFTLAIIPKLSGISTDANALNGITEWIVDNADAKNIKYTVQLGDIFSGTHMQTNYWKTVAVLNSSFPQGDGMRAFGNQYTKGGYEFGFYAAAGKVLLNGEYDTTISTPLANLKAAMQKLNDANIPYAINPSAGDHASAMARNWSFLSTVFSYDDFTFSGQYGVENASATYGLTASKLSKYFEEGYFDGKADTDLSTIETVIANGYLKQEDLFETVTGLSNIYYTFEANGENYIVINLEAQPRLYNGTAGNRVLNNFPAQWANDLLAQFHDHKAIVITENFAKNDGSLAICWSAENGKNIGSYWNKDNNPSLSGLTITNNSNPNWQGTGNLTIYGDELWRTVLQKHDNLVAVVCAESRVITQNKNNGVVYSSLTGINGNEVQVVRADLSGVIKDSTNGLMLLRFAPDGAMDTVFVSPSDSYYTYHNVVEAPATYSVTGNGVNTAAAGGETVTITPTVAEGENAVAVVLEYTLDTTYYEGITVYTEAYNPTYEKVVSGNGSFTFEMPYADVTVKEVITKAAGDVKIALSATSMRLDNPGMRFLATVYAEETDAARAYEYGIIMVPVEVFEAYYGEDEFVFDGDTFIVEEALIIPMVNKYSYSPYHFSYTGVLTGIPEAAYGMDIMVMAYVKTDEGTYEYSNVLVRSASEIAGMAFYSGNESMANDTALAGYMVD